MASKKPLNSPKRRCLFCGTEGKLTAEHVNPAWLKRYINQKYTGTRHRVRFNGVSAKGKLNRPGDPLSQKLKVLCSHCNNVEMGSLQEAAKKVLLPLVLGIWRPLSEEDERVLSAWAVMTTMVWESAHPPSAASTEEERFRFRLAKAVPEDWTVWIGKQKSNHFGAFNHVGWTWGSIHLARNPVDPKPNSQTTGWIVGNLLILTLKAPWNTGTVREQFAKSFAESCDIRAISPSIPHKKTPTTVYDHVGWQKVARAIPLSFGIPETISPEISLGKL